jgi:pimeloyl-ACP methyl ester carboxylesterase
MTLTNLHSVTLSPLSEQTGAEQIVILHGWKNNLEFWRPVGELLSAHATVHLIDLPGFGKSELPPTTWGVKDYAERVVEYLHLNKIASATLLGHSFGGRISVVLAATHPELVSNLILVNTHGLQPKRSLEQRLKIAYIKLLRSIIKFIDKLFFTKIFKNWFAPKYGSPDYKSAGELRNTFLKVINEDLASYAKKIKARTLLLWGEKDTETPLSIGEKYHELIKNSELVVLKNKKHDMFMDVGGHLVVFHLLKFLGLGSKSASKGAKISNE